MASLIVVDSPLSCILSLESVTIQLGLSDYRETGSWGMDDGKGCDVGIGLLAMGRAPLFSFGRIALAL
jgi:hypothetical protein